MNLKNIVVAGMSILVLSGCGNEQKSDIKNFSGDFAVGWGSQTQQSGVITLNDKTLSRFEVNGSAKFNNVMVTEKLEVNGSLQAQDSEIKNLEINGVARLLQSKVTGVTTIAGTLYADASEFGDLNIASEHVVFKDSHTKNIIIKKTHPKKEQVVELINSTVDGNITFEELPGKVILVNSSKITGSTNGQVARS